MRENRKFIIYQCTKCGQKIYKYYVCPNCKSNSMRFVGPMELKDLTSDIKEGYQS